MSLQRFLGCIFWFSALCRVGKAGLPDEHKFMCRTSGVLQGLQGPPGPPGPPGAKGKAGSCAENCKDKLYSSCEAIKKNMKSAKSGLYTLMDNQGSKYRTYCDMKVDGGGWTLVASIHENNMDGKCTTGDRWSSEHGNTPGHPHGDGAWENAKTFGRAESATSDDYKNPGYFNMQAKNVMLWHVPNNELLKDYSSKAFLKYYTKSNFLANYGNNLYNLFRTFYPLRDRTYQKSTGNGPAPAVTWVVGDNNAMRVNTAPNMRAETTPGFIQFRAINHERGAFAICPGVKIKPNYGNVEHSCIGGTSNHGESHKQCGDFASKDWNGYGTGVHWSSNRLMTESVVMIFYR